MDARLVPLALVLLGYVGCAENNESGMMPGEPAETTVVPAAPGAMARRIDSATHEFSRNPQGGAPETSDVSPAMPRKIIYTAELEVVVEDLGTSEAELTKLVRQYGGYLAESSVAGTAGSHRSGRWKVRVPVERFDTFVDAVAHLGELQKRATGSQDATEEFYDLEARLKNKHVEEDRLIKHLEETAGELKEILEVERELSRVREEIERMEGRRRLLENLAALTTVTINLFERNDYIPPIAPTFGQQIARTFNGSVEALVSLGKAFVLLAVALAPWLPLLLLLAGAIWVFVRVLVRLANASRPRAGDLPPVRID